MQAQRFLNETYNPLRTNETSQTAGHRRQPADGMTLLELHACMGSELK